MGLLSDVLSKLQTGEVTFEFRTRSGKIRRARGTLNQNRIPREDWSKGKLLRKPAPKTDEYSVRSRMFQPFYDLELGEWRRFKALSLIRILNFRSASNIKPIEDEDLD